MTPPTRPRRLTRAQLVEQQLQGRWHYLGRDAGTREDIRRSGCGVWFSWRLQTAMESQAVEAGRHRGLEICEACHPDGVSTVFR